MPVEPGRRPRMVSVQAAGCAPIVEAFERGLDHGVTPEAPHTLASGLRVPAAVGDFLILQALRESEGTAVAVPDAEMLTALTTLAAGTGVCPAPEGAAAFAATVRLAAEGWIRPEESVVLFNTGTGLKYPEALAAAVAD